MFGIGLTEMLVIGAIALIFIGPDQLPSVARTLGRFINDLRRSSDEIKKQFQDQTSQFKQAMDDQKNEIKKAINDPPPLEHKEDEYKPPAPHKGDNLAEMFPELYGDKAQQAQQEQSIAPPESKDEDKKKG